MTVIRPSNDKHLAIATGTATQSPFVIAFQRSGVATVPHIINAVVCTSAISGSSSCVFIASRTLYGLSQDRHAPKFFQRCNRFGTPYYAVSLTVILLPLMYMSLGSSAAIVFAWFVNITTVASLIGWIVIGGTYLRFHACLREQGYSRTGLLGIDCVEIDAKNPCSTPLSHAVPALHHLGNSLYGYYACLDFWLSSFHPWKFHSCRVPDFVSEYRDFHWYGCI